MLLDLILVSIASYLVISLFNSREGIRYCLTTLFWVILLAVSAFWRLNAVHLFSQLALAVMIIGLPVYFHEQWTNLFIKKVESNRLPLIRPKYIGKTGLIALSVILSAVLLLIDNGLPTKVAEFPEAIPLQATNLSAGTSAGFGSVNSVRVIVSATPAQWKKLDKGSFSATVDAANQPEGTYDLPVNIQIKQGDSKIVRIKPERVTVTIEPVIVKTVPVVVRFSGKAGNDLVPDDAQITPAKVEITGPRSSVKDVTQASVDIKLAGETATIDTKVAVAIKNAEGEVIAGISSNPAEVGIKVPLVKAGKLKTVGVRAVITGQPASGWWVKSVAVTPPTLSITGTADLLAQTTDVPTASFSVEGLSSNQSEKVALNLPTGITSADQLTKITLTIELAKLNSTKSVFPEIVYSGLSGGLKVTSVTPGQITAIVSGSVDGLASVDGKVTASVDLSAYKTAGSYVINLTNSSFTLPDGFSMVSFLPSAIEVKLDNK